MSAQYFYESPEELVEDLRVCAPAMEELADLVRLFAEIRRAEACPEYDRLF